jgi:hypothetical protein
MANVRLRATSLARSGRAFLGVVDVFMEGNEKPPTDQSCGGRYGHGLYSGHFFPFAEMVRTTWRRYATFGCSGSHFIEQRFTTKPMSQIVK